MGDTQPHHAKTTGVSFKVEEELAEFLRALPNTSEFIRKAIIAKLGMKCPLCGGRGILTGGLEAKSQNEVGSKEPPLTGCSEDDNSMHDQASSTLP
jgi:hypothetical protein